jgi:hypothetical protein
MNVEQKSGYDLGQTRGSYQQADWSSIFSTIGEAFSNPSSVYERTTNRMQDALDNGKDLFAKLAGTAEPDLTAWDIIDLKEPATNDDTDPTTDLEKLFEGIVDDEITITPLHPLKNEEVALREYIQQNPKTVSSKLLSLLISEARANDGSPITEAQKQSVIRQFINDVGGGIINLESKIGTSLRENYPTLMNVIDKSLETVGAVMMASAKGWTLALSDAKSDAEASQKVAEFVVGVEETLKKYTSKEERKVLEYAVGGALVGKAAKQSLTNFLSKEAYKEVEGVLYTKTGVKLVKDVRLDGYTSEAARDLLKDVHFTEIKSAEIMNEQLSKYYNKPPFVEVGKVGVFETERTTKFTRLYISDSTGDNRIGRFLALERDIKDLSPNQIKDKFDLPYLPTHVTVVVVPKGHKITVGTVKDGNFGGRGTGTQFYLTDKSIGDVFFGKGRSINDKL